MNESREAKAFGGFERREMLRSAGLGGALALMGSIGAAKAAGNGPFPEHPKWRLVFVNHVTTNPFFVPTQYGIKDACDLLDCTYQWTGSANADVGQMVNAMNAAIAAKADAIAVPIVDPRAFNDPTEKALQAGIPVFSYNADAPAGSGNKRLAYIGQDLYQSGSPGFWSASASLPLIRRPAAIRSCSWGLPRG
jgi:simple sugar transport system substrate-binding protein